MEVDIFNAVKDMKAFKKLVNFVIKFIKKVQLKLLKNKFKQEIRERLKVNV